MEILKNLEAQRQMLINALYTENRWEFETQLPIYEANCRTAGIDPDAWEGLR